MRSQEFRKGKWGEQEVGSGECAGSRMVNSKIMSCLQASQDWLLIFYGYLGLSYLGLSWCLRCPDKPPFHEMIPGLFDRTVFGPSNPIDRNLPKDLKPLTMPLDSFDLVWCVKLWFSQYPDKFLRPIGKLENSCSSFFPCLCKFNVALQNGVTLGVAPFWRAHH